MPFIVNPDFYYTLKDVPLNFGPPGYLGNDFSTVGSITAPFLIDGPDNGTWLAFIDGSFTYTPNAGFVGVDTITIQENNGIVSKNSVITIEVNDPADPRVVVVYPNFYNVAMNGVASIAAPGYLDNDFTTSGTLTTPVLLDGPDHGTWSALVNGEFTYTPSASFIGVDTVTVSVTNGTVTKTEIVTINVYAPNDAPAASNLGAAETYTEDTARNLIDIVVSDDDNANVTVQLTLSVPSAGTLTTATAGAVTSTYVAGTGTWTASGATADVNALLAGLVFNPAANFNGSFTIATSVSDGVAPAVTGSKVLTGNAVNDAPVITSNGGGATANVNVAERSTAVTIVTATDLESASFTFSINGGSDAAKFQIDPVTGVLSFVDAPNFEVPGDSDTNNSYVVQVRASDGLASDLQTITVNVTDVTPEPSGNDFNADGFADIFWQTDGGALAIWEMNGIQIGAADYTRLGQSAVGVPGKDWHIVDTGDFNGDSRSDVLWRTDSGALALWEMDGTHIEAADFLKIGSSTVGTPGADWHALGAADFDGDGKTDILWRTDSGALAIWEMDGNQVAGADFIHAGANKVGQPGADWNIVGTGDFDGDGKADLLWRTDSGALAVWEMDGKQIKSAEYLKAGSSTVGAPGADWHVADVADFNGDGRADILWRIGAAQTGDLAPGGGQVAIWEMNGNQIEFADYTRTGSAIAGAPGADWHLLGADDHNGDGMADLLWQTDAGALAIWEMDGTQVDSAGYTKAGANNVGIPGSDWHVYQHHYDLV